MMSITSWQRNIVFYFALLFALLLKSAFAALTYPASYNVLAGTTLTATQSSPAFTYKVNFFTNILQGSTTSCGTFTSFSNGVFYATAGDYNAACSTSDKKRKASVTITCGLTESYIASESSACQYTISITTIKMCASPTFAPSRAPTFKPTSKPTFTPSYAPTYSPTFVPSRAPTFQPTSKPTFTPSYAPTYSPTSSPSFAPTFKPTFTPSYLPTYSPTYKPTALPTFSPSNAPTYLPTFAPTISPTAMPTSSPSHIPSLSPTFGPTRAPTLTPSNSPTTIPTHAPTFKPTNAPSTTTPIAIPTSAPTYAPTGSPTFAPTLNPSVEPSANPSRMPSVCPSRPPTNLPSTSPSLLPTPSPTTTPSINPFNQPTVLPTFSPSSSPSLTPSNSPSAIPTSPSFTPTYHPSEEPTCHPTSRPTHQPTVSPSVNPSTTTPTQSPSQSPSVSPTNYPTSLPTSGSPTSTPTIEPSMEPTFPPSTAPTTSIPSYLPTLLPSFEPTMLPSRIPTQLPSTEPSTVPSATPTTTTPTESPSITPTSVSTTHPSHSPSMTPSAIPTTTTPTLEPSQVPSIIPTELPSALPTLSPTIIPTDYPSTTTPTINPSLCPSRRPSLHPSNSPTLVPSPDPSRSPTTTPSIFPSTTNPTTIPSEQPTITPSHLPTTEPTIYPSCSPSQYPSQLPSTIPSESPSLLPTERPTTTTPSELPTTTPTTISSHSPSVKSSSNPTILSTWSPSSSPIFAKTTTPISSKSSASITPTAVGFNKIQILNRAELQARKVNPASKFIVTGTIYVQKSCYAFWQYNSNSSLVDLSTTSLTQISQVVQARKNYTLSVYLPSNILLIGQNYIFSLNCGDLSSSVVITVNSPPIGGNFTIYPHSGEELHTIFLLSAFDWFDVDLPISYAFGFVTSTSVNTVLIISEKSIISSTSSNLPSGKKQDNYRVECILKVIDNLDCSNSIPTNVFVHPIKSFSDVSTFVSKLSNSTSSKEQVTRSIMVISSILNNVNCTSSYNCSALNRRPCMNVAHTCGFCLSSYSGEIGSHNTACVSASNFYLNLNTNKTIGMSSCDSNQDCGPFKFCNNNKCVLQPKRCTNDCTKRGNCTFQNVNTGRTSSDCSVLSTNCVAICNCFVGYSSADCSLTSQQLLLKQSIRENLMIQLSAVTSISNSSSVTPNMVQSWISSLSTMTTNSDELSEKSSLVAFEVTFDILSRALILDSVSYDSVTGALDSINSITESNSKIPKGDTVKSLLNLYNSLTMRDILAGQNNIENIQKGFRMAVHSFDLFKNHSVAIIESPLTNLEKQLNRTIRNSVQLDTTFPSGQSSSLKVSITEMASKLFGNVSSRYISNSIVVKISGFDGLRVLNKTTGESDVIIRLQNNLPQNYDHSFINFTTKCIKDIKSLSNFSCPLSGVTLYHNCTGKSGVYTSYCPVLRPVCVTSGSSSDIGQCIVLQFDSRSTTCKCKMYALPNRRLIDSTIQQTVDSSGVLNLVSMAEFTAAEFVDSFSLIDDFASPEAFSQSLIVILLLVVLWTVGVFFIFVCGWRRNLVKSRINAIDEQTKRKAKSAAVSRSPIAICNNLQEYVAEIFPSVFSPKSRIHRLVDEVKRHHRYLNIFTLSQGDFGERTRVLIGFQLLTIQTMLIFLLAVFYDLQCPSDDGSCIQFYTESACLSRKTYVDVTQSYCTWVASSPIFESPGTDNNNYPCVYQDPTFTLKVMFYIAVLVSVTTSIFIRPIDIVFEILSSPIADSEKVSNVETTTKKIMRRASNAARRVSIVAANTASAIANTIGRRRNLAAGSKTILIPASTKSAQSIASAAMSIVSSNAEKNLECYQHNQQLNKNLLRQKYEDENDSDSDKSDESSSPYHSTYSNSLTKKSVVFSILKMETKDILMRLLDDINCQRQYLKPSELDIFDKQWGIDPTGEFSKGMRSLLFKSITGAEDNIKREIELVKKITNQKIEKLNLATDAHVGVELMHLFILDLLGRETPAARIFEVKAKEDFIHTRVVTNRTRILCVTFLLLLNLFFAFYIILRGYSKGYDWQYTFLIACISQIFVEMILFETVECIWIQFFVPNLVSTEVLRVNTILMDIITDLVVKNDRKDDDKNVLDAPNYLFISTNLAKTYPTIMESFIILSYHSYYPGELSNKWQTGSIARIRRHDQFHQSIFMSTMVLMLQILATLPFLVQRMFVRFTQPFFLFGLIYLGTLMIENVVYTAVVSVFLFLFIAYFIYIYFFKKKPKNSINPTNPISPADNMLDDEIVFVNLTASDEGENDDYKKDLSSTNTELGKSQNNGSHQEHSSQYDNNILIISSKSGSDISFGRSKFSASVDNTKEDNYNSNSSYNNNRSELYEDDNYDLNITDEDEVSNSNDTRSNYSTVADSKKNSNSNNNNCLTNSISSENSKNEYYSEHFISDSNNNTNQSEYNSRHTSDSNSNYIEESNNSNNKDSDFYGSGDSYNNSNDNSNQSEYHSNCNSDNTVM